MQTSCGLSAALDKRLQLASENGHMEAAALLFRSGADVHSDNCKAYSLLGMATTRL
jgi:ankyrin repeat protein